MVDARLFLPESWCNNDLRCQEAGIPKGDRVFKPKWRIAIDIIGHQKEMGVDFDYVGGDGYYGNSVELAEAIENMGFIYMLDIHSNLTVYLEECETGIPPSTGRGLKPTKEKPLSEGIRADRYMSGLTDKDWQGIDVCNNIPLLSAHDIKRWIIFKLYRQMSEDDMIDQIFERHCRRQNDINLAFDKQSEIC